MINIDENYSRDMNSKAILSTNKKALMKHREELKFKNEINTLKQTVEKQGKILNTILNILEDKYGNTTN